MEFACAAIEMRVRAPAQLLRAVEDFLDTHLQDDIGMRADPRPQRGDFAQQRVERLSGLAPMDGSTQTSTPSAASSCSRTSSANSSS